MKDFDFGFVAVDEEELHIAGFFVINKYKYIE